MRYSRHHRKEGELLRERQGTPISVSYAAAFQTIGCVTHTTTGRRVSSYVSGGDDLDLGGFRVGGRNHFPGVSGHWGDSGVRGGGGSSSRSGDPLGISRTTGGGFSCDARGWLNCDLLVLTRDAGGWIGCWRLKSYFKDEVRKS